MDTLRHLDRQVGGFFSRWGVTALRVSLAVVFIWFGALKIFGETPVADLVANTVYWFDSDWVVPALGVVEVIVGLGLLFQVAMRAVLGLFFIQMIGTFLVFLLQPEVAFQNGNPLLLTVEGEFVVKNLVLIAAGMVIAGTVEVD
jgi:putative oxidoreductase